MPVVFHMPSSINIRPSTRPAYLADKPCKSATCLLEPKLSIGKRHYSSISFNSASKFQRPSLERHVDSAATDSGDNLIETVLQKIDQTGVCRLLDYILSGFLSTSGNENETKAEN